MSTNDERALPREAGLVFVGGFAGVLVRAGLDHLFPNGTAFLITTLTINIAGALALAVLIETLAFHGSDVGRRRTLRLLLGTGLLGGFTTYSALAVSTETLLRAGNLTAALTYSIGTVAVGFVASLLGIALTRRAMAR